ncbi:50S ribosomal protein L24e [Candidatus Woesearchaeota archaeon]|nr:50S ribosomal protein L24e [Candidatus Woesearchaeota archaeon]|tara:strand:+ start:113 stop:307 length:195 start_codon:yes stop_codon:yes gene_type:complete
MARCDFCHELIEKGTGKRFIKKDGKMLDFCSRKCEKNMIKLRRKSLTTEWTRAFQKQKKTGKTK